MMSRGDYIAWVAFFSLFAAGLAASWVRSRLRVRWLQRRLFEGHEWAAVPPDGPPEEGGVCRHCGAWATSEQETACWPKGRGV